MIYGVYENKALVHWPPSKIFGDEIRVRTGVQPMISQTSNILTWALFRRSLAPFHKRTASLVRSLTWIVAKST